MCSIETRENQYDEGDLRRGMQAPLFLKYHILCSIKSFCAMMKGCGLTAYAVQSWFES